MAVLKHDVDTIAYDQFGNGPIKLAAGTRVRINRVMANGLVATCNMGVGRAKMLFNLPTKSLIKFAAEEEDEGPSEIKISPEEFERMVKKEPKVEEVPIDPEEIVEEMEETKPEAPKKTEEELEEEETRERAEEAAAEGLSVGLGEEPTEERIEEMEGFQVIELRPARSDADAVRVAELVAQTPAGVKKQIPVLQYIPDVPHTAESFRTISKYMPAFATYPDQGPNKGRFLLIENVELGAGWIITDLQMPQVAGAPAHRGWWVVGQAKQGVEKANTIMRMEMETSSQREGIYRGFMIEPKFNWFEPELKYTVRTKDGKEAGTAETYAKATEMIDKWAS